MTLHSGWTTERGAFGTNVCDPTGKKDLCYHEGAISYMTQSMMCCQHENVVQPAPGESPIEGGYKNAMTHNKGEIKTRQDEPTTMLETGVAPAAAQTHDVVQNTEAANHGNVHELPGKDIEFPKVENCPSQLEFGHSGGTEEKSSEAFWRN